MTEQDQDWMNRYIYQVVRRLPKDQRTEVGLELQELIGDMMAETGSIEAVLIKLGNPAEFAKKYQNSNHYLIGPEYYDTYLWFLKIVLVCTLAAVLLASVLEGFLAGAAASDTAYLDKVITGIVEGLAGAIANSILSCACAFGGVTLVFAVMERQKVKLERKKEWSVNDLGDLKAGGRTVWTPGSLAPIPHKKAAISRGDSIVGIIFIVIFCALLIFAPRLFSVIFREDGSFVTIPVFNLAEWNVILPVFLIGLLIGLADEILRLVVGRYCTAVMISNIVCGILQFSLSVVVLKVFPFWNPDFGVQIQSYLDGQQNGSLDFLAKWNGNTAANAILILIGIITLAEIGTTLYKTLRYGAERNSPVG